MNVWKHGKRQMCFEGASGRNIVSKGKGLHACPSSTGSDAANLTNNKLFI